MLKNIFPEFTSNSSTSVRKRRSLTIVHWALAVATVLAVSTYSGGGGAEALPRDVSPLAKLSPGICGTAIPLSDSSCKKDNNKNLEIGPNGCGPNVYVDKNYQ